MENLLIIIFFSAVVILVYAGFKKRLKAKIYILDYVWLFLATVFAPYTILIILSVKFTLLREPLHSPALIGGIVVVIFLFFKNIKGSETHEID